MLRVLKGHNSSRVECKLEITDAGWRGLVWLNIVYNKPDEQKPYIVVKKAELIKALNQITKAGLI